MSIPMVYCDMVKAAKGDEKAYENLRDTLMLNLKTGHFSTFPCNHTPVCTATEEQVAKLNARIKADVYDKLEEEDDKAALEFDKDKKLVSKLYWAGAEYADELDVAMGHSGGKRGFPGPSGDQTVDYGEFIMFCHLVTVSECLARSCKARKNKASFARFKEEIANIEKQYGLGS